MTYAVIFDMDGLLIESEPLWKEAERQVFSSVGVQVTDSLAEQTAAMTTRAVTEFWFSRNPWVGKSLDEVEDAEARRCVSHSGLIAAKRANIQAVAVPHPDEYHNEKFTVADLKLKSLSDFNDEHLMQLLR
ncbi:hypothetical protein [Photobacterium chitinilyticum]|uniref:Hexitol phosphatase HxpB n=1 Tax=Photobacterium chitinilyticum TaxID=2485123 RepID=A0A3S3RGV7_9GAMM|nr:hypothetical protein [Photobacterium chitinilyticum]RWX55026.1 hypothetical protein EDI28_14935 [Photobacterium chitinilyticum]